MTLEPPMEQVQESVHHQAEHSGDRWSTMVALSTAILAMMAAIAALLAEHYAHESLHKHLEANDKWSEGQAKNEKSAILSGTAAVLEAIGKPVPKKITDKIKDEDAKKLKAYAEADKDEKENNELYARHEWLAGGVTLFQVAVAVSAIAVLTKRRWFWYLSLVFAVGAVSLMIYGLTFTPSSESDAFGADKATAPSAEKKASPGTGQNIDTKTDKTIVPGTEMKTSPGAEKAEKSHSALWRPAAIQHLWESDRRENPNHEIRLTKEFQMSNDELLTRLPGEVSFRR